MITREQVICLLYENMCGSNSDLQPRSVHPANPAPLQRERELHSNKPNSAPRDATVAVGREKAAAAEEELRKTQFT